MRLFIQMIDMEIGNHTEEEIRNAAIHVLKGTVDGDETVNQYNDLKLNVGILLRDWDGLPKQPTSVYPADSALTKEDSDLFLEVFWDLFRDGIITLGRSENSQGFPFFRVSSRGKRMLEQDEEFFLHDVSGFERQIKARIPDIDESTLVYLKESLNSFRSGCVLASTVMLGVATEHSFLRLVEAIDKNPAFAATFDSIQSKRTILQKVIEFRKLVVANKGNLQLPRELLDDFETNFFGIQSLIRVFRNESGHPSGEFISREQAYVNLSLFVAYGRKVYQFIKFFE